VASASFCKPATEFTISLWNFIFNGLTNILILFFRINNAIHGIIAYNVILVYRVAYEAFVLDVLNNFRRQRSRIMSLRSKAKK